MANKTIKVIVLTTTQQLLISEIVEVSAVDIGQPDCKLTNPFWVNPLEGTITLEPFLNGVTKEDEFMMVVNASNREKDLDWLTSNIQGNVMIKDISEIMALIAIQGPRSKDILQMLTDSNLNNLRFYQVNPRNLNAQ